MRYIRDMKYFRKNFRAGLLVSALILVSCPGPANQDTTTNQQEEENDLPDIVDELSYNYTLLRYYYLYAQDEMGPYPDYIGRGEDIPFGDVLDMYAGLSDRWTNYWPPANSAGILDQLATSGNEQKLVGMHLIVEPTAEADQSDLLFIYRIWIGSPAEASDLKEGDCIIVINDVDLTTNPPLKGNDLLARYQEAAAGDTVSFTILREGDRILVPSITKQVMRPPTVFLDYIEEIPVIQITGFSEDSGYNAGAADKNSNTGAELRAALTRVKSGAYPVGIIDIRGNPGGSVNQCFAGIEELVAGGIYIQYENHYYDGEKGVVDKISQVAAPGGMGESTQWIFLADGYSASAAEILLYAVKNCRPETHIIGETTYGKGVGQYYISPTRAKGLAGITALKFFDKDGNTFHETGIVPDQPEESADVLEAAVTYALSILPDRGRSLLGSAATINRAAIRTLDKQLKTRQVPSDGIRGGAWEVRGNAGL
ncbi:hypothetical protein AGMMS4952_06250 [Spirochaetia bacterium]|nr:hypothetical protein AGMMS4952_06250 [Spirochaetia bacterium]